MNKSKKKTTNKIKNGDYEFEKMDDTYPKNIFNCHFFNINRLSKNAHCEIKEKDLYNYEECCTKHEGEPPKTYCNCLTFLEKLGNMTIGDRLRLRELQLMNENLRKTSKSVSTASKALFISFIIVLITIGSVGIQVYYNSEQMKIEEKRLFAQFRPSIDINILGDKLYVKNTSKISLHNVQPQFRYLDSGTVQLTGTLYFEIPSEGVYPFWIPVEYKNKNKLFEPIETNICYYYDLDPTVKARVVPLELKSDYIENVMANTMKGYECIPYTFEFNGEEFVNK